MGIPDIATSALRVAVLSRSRRHRTTLSEILEANGLLAVNDEVLQEQLLQGALDVAVADVVLVNLDETDAADDTLLDALMDQVELPILFNDAAASRFGKSLGAKAWGRRLAAKLTELAQEVATPEPPDHRPDLQLVEAQTEAVEASPESAPQALDIEDIAQGLEQIHEALTHDLPDEVIPELGVEAVIDVPAVESFEEVPVLDEPAPAAAPGAQRVWVLGASIGGPQALKEFLAELPAGLPVGFVLAQHIGSGFVNLLADQLGRVTALDVFGAQDGLVPGLGQVLVAPVEERLSFDADGCVRLLPVERRGVYSPSIDDVMTAVAQQYGADAGAIVFSGMGNDGLAGSRAIVEGGGTVWAQDASTCVISSMADSVRGAGLASVTAPPRELARLLLDTVERGC